MGRTAGSLNKNWSGVRKGKAEGKDAATTFLMKCLLDFDEEFGRHSSLELYATPKEKEDGKLKQSQKCRHSGLLAEDGPLHKDLKEVLDSHV